MAYTFIGDHLIADAAWGRRQESFASSAEMTARFLTALAAVDPVFSRWYKQGNSYNASLKCEVHADDPEALQQLFRKAQHRADDRRTILYHLGYDVTLVNGLRGLDEAKLSIHCGDYSRRGVNCVDLSLPYAWNTQEQQVAKATLLALLRLLVHIWRPDVATIRSNKYFFGPNRPDDTIVGGWYTYLPEPPSALPALPAPARVLPIDLPGTLIQSLPEFIHAANPQHVQAQNRLMQCLFDHGFLRKHAVTATDY